MVCKKYEIRRGRLLYRDELEFKSTLHELFWKALMKTKGCDVKELRYR